MKTASEIQAEFPKGATVRHCNEDIERKRQYWLQQGREPAKSNAKRWWKEFEAERGTVLDSGIGANGYAFVSVSWHGKDSISHCLTYKVVICD